MECVSWCHPVGNRDRDRDRGVECDRPSGISKTARNADQIARRAGAVAAVLATNSLITARRGRDGRRGKRMNAPMFWIAVYTAAVGIVSFAVFYGGAIWIERRREYQRREAHLRSRLGKRSA